MSVYSLAERLAARGAAVHEVVAVAEADRRHSDLGEGEMVGAIEMARFGMRVGAVIAALLLAFRDQHVEQAELGVAGDGEVLRRAVDRAAVGVDDARCLGDREERVLGIIFGAEQALLLGGDGEEDDRAVGPRLVREGARLLDQLGDAGRVVERAVIDGVAASRRACRCRDGPSAPSRSPSRRGTSCREGSRRHCAS